MDQVSKAASLAELATEVSLFALGMRDRAASAQFSGVHDGAMRLLEEFESRAKTERFDPGDIADAKFALAAFVDEVVLSAEWPGIEQWAEDPLQLHYFGTYLAGEDFFLKLDAIRSQAKARAGALNVYYQCLLLGFKGKYGIESPDKLDSLKRAIKNELEREQPPNPTELCPQWKPADSPASQTNKLPRWFIYACLAVVAACVLLYVFFFFSLRTKAENSRQISTPTYFAQLEKSGGAVQ
jgi:type VI secretion system protein ImpK